MPVYLNGLSTAVPPHELPQDLVLKSARRILAPRFEQFDRLSGTFLTAGVDRRYSLAPIDWFEEPRGWPERNALYLEGATELFIEAARRALDTAQLEDHQVDAIVTVSSTGIATPTLEARAWNAMGFRSDVHRVPVFGLGCAGGVSGLSIAHSLAQANPGSQVLLVVLEACTLSFRSNRLRKADIIATVLFGDGAAAAVLSTSRSDTDCPNVELEDGQQEIWSDTLEIMGWDADETGLGVIFDQSIPAFTEEHFPAAADRALGRAGYTRGDIDRFVFHPGGAKVVAAIESALELEQDSLDSERDVLREFGNMSAPTALFVLDRVIRSGRTGRMMLCALGPGFTASFMPLHVGRSFD